jgi:hypothetical protein
MAETNTLDYFEGLNEDPKIDKTEEIETPQEDTPAVKDKQDDPDISGNKTPAPQPEFFFGEEESTTEEEPADIGGLTDDVILQYLKEKKGYQADSLEQLSPAKEQVQVSDELLKVQQFLNNGGTWEEYAKLQKDLSSIDKKDLIKDYLREAEKRGEKSINIELKKMRVKEISDDDFIDENTIDELKEKNEEAEALEEDYYNKALTYFQDKKDKFSANLKTPSQEEILKANQVSLEEYYNTLDKFNKDIHEIEIKNDEGKTAFKAIYTDKDRQTMNELSKSSDSFNRYFDEKGKMKPDLAAEFQENTAWSNPEFRHAKLLHIVNNAVNYGKESVMKERKNITIDKKSTSTVLNSHDSAEMRAAFEEAGMKY